MEVNLRGQVFAFTAKEEEALQQSPLYKVITQEIVERDGKGRRVIDCDPSMFSLAVHYLTTSQLGWDLPLPRATLRQLGQAANQLKLPALEEAAVLRDIAQLTCDEPVFEQLDALANLVRIGRVEQVLDCTSRLRGYDDQGRFDLDDLRLYARRRKDDWAANYLIALNFFVTQFSDEPARCVLRAYNLVGERSACVSAMCSAYYAYGQAPVAALEVARKALEHHPHHWELHYRAALATAIASRHDASAAEDGDDAACSDSASGLLLRSDATVDAQFKAYLASAKEFAPEHYAWAPLALEAWVALAGEAYDDAARAFAAACAAAPECERSSLEKGLLGAQQRQNADAKSDFWEWDEGIFNVQFAYTSRPMVESAIEADSDASDSDY